MNDRAWQPYGREVALFPATVIREVQGQRVSNVEEFRAAIERSRSGQRIRLYVSTPIRGGDVVSTYRVLQVP